MHFPRCDGACNLREGTILKVEEAMPPGWGLMLHAQSISMTGVGSSSTCSQKQHSQEDICM